MTAIENTHFGFHKGAAAGKHKSYSYRLQTADRLIVFTGDTGPFAGLVGFAKGADLLVAEAGDLARRAILVGGQQLGQAGRGPARLFAAATGPRCRDKLSL